MKKIFALTLTIFLFAQLLSAHEIAEDDTIRNYKLDEIIIKSPKYNRNIFDIPAAATMLPERLIENSKIENLTNISGFIPNLFMPDYGSKLTSPIYIRGVGNRIIRHQSVFMSMIFRILKNQHSISIFMILNGLRFCAARRELYMAEMQWEGLSM
jgi:hypothetical protein